MTETIAPRPNQTLTTTPDLRAKAQRCLGWLRVEWNGEKRPWAIVEICEVLEAVAKDVPK